MVNIRRLAAAAAPVAIISLLVGCESSDDDSMTADDIRDRTAAAMRDAGTFSFEQKLDHQSSTGAVSYGPDGEVEGLVVRSDFTDRDRVEESRYLEGDLYSRVGDDAFTTGEDDDAREFVDAWDWAAAIEGGPPVEELTEAGEDTVDGQDATKYELTFGDNGADATWWVGEDDRLLKAEAEDGLNAVLSDYGKDVDISVPDDVAD